MLFKLHGLRVTPRYFEGKEPFENPRIQRMFLWVAGAVLRKKTWVLAWLIARLEALEKRFRQDLKLRASWTEGCPISIVSSTNC